MGVEEREGKGREGRRGCTVSGRKGGGGEHVHFEFRYLMFRMAFDSRRNWMGVGRVKSLGRSLVILLFDSSTCARFLFIEACDVSWL